jgi:hypothetical protein
MTDLPTIRCTSSSTKCLEHLDEYSMASPEKKSQHGNKDREQRFAALSEGMAIARLSHQVKELELQKHKQDALAMPVFTPIKTIMFAPSRLC